MSLWQVTKWLLPSRAALDPAAVGGGGGGAAVAGSPMGLLLALTYSPAPTTGQPIGLLLSLTKSS